MNIQEATDWVKDAGSGVLSDLFDRDGNVGSGSGNMRRCPSKDHEDRNASCSLSTSRSGHATFKCFTCPDVGGTAIDYWMLTRGSDDFVETLQGILETFGRKLDIKEPTGNIPRYVQAARERLVRAEPYLSARGIGMEVAKRWKMGVGGPVPGITDVGEKEDRRFWKMVEGRLIIPHCDAANRVIGFTARDLTGESTRKYVISKGFSKADRFFACHKLGQRPTWVVVIEGQVDTIMVNELCEVTAVGSSGAVSNPSQVAQIPDGSVVVLIPDNDPPKPGKPPSNPGIEAALTGSGLLVDDTSFTLRILVPEPGVDPDEWARSDPDGLHDAIIDAPLWIDWRIEQASRAGWTPEDQAAVRAAIPQSVPPRLRAQAESRLASELGRSVPFKPASRRRWSEDVPTPVAVYLEACANHQITPDPRLLSEAGFEGIGLDGILRTKWDVPVDAAVRNLEAYVASKHGATPVDVARIRQRVAQ